MMYQYHILYIKYKKNVKMQYFNKRNYIEINEYNPLLSQLQTLGTEDDRERVYEFQHWRRDSPNTIKVF